MVTTITIDEISEDIMENFFTIMKANVTSVSVPNPNGGNITYTIQFYATPNNDKLVKKEDNYPILLVDNPRLPEDELTFRDMIISGSITLEIHAQNSRATTKFMDLIKKTVRDNKSDLRSVGLDQLKVTEEDNDFFDREGFKDHWATVTYSFEYDYTDGS